MEINLNKLNEKELFNLKNKIDVKLTDIETTKKMGKEFKSQNTQCLGHLEKDDLILCINFSGEKIYNIDYVNIRFGKKEDSGSYTNFTASHDTNKIGCSSALSDEYLHEQYFLSDFTSSWYFFTLSPNTWKDDLVSAMKKYKNRKKEYYTNEVNSKVNNIKKFIDTFDISHYI
tara:strand:+ start:80 stop:598 length:519 start_codon:yes stop_codon:yes gene_type:complete